MGERAELNTEIELRDKEIEKLKLELTKTQVAFLQMRQQHDSLALEKLDTMIEKLKETG